MSRRDMQFAMRAATWLPVLFCGMRALTQTSGLAAPMAGDCSMNGTAVTCTKSNGVALGLLATQNSVTMVQLPVSVTATMPLVTSVPVDAGGAEYPMLDDGATLTDISGNGRNGTFGVGAGAPTQLGYGLGFGDADGSFVNSAGRYITVPVTQWQTVEAYACMATMGQTTGTAVVSNPGQQAPTIFGSSVVSSGVNAMLSDFRNLTQYRESAYPAIAADVGSVQARTSAYHAYGNCHDYVFVLGAGTPDQIYVDGYAVPLAAQASTSPATTTGSYLIGNASDPMRSSFHGVLEYLKVWATTPLTAVQVQAENAYVQARVAARLNKPAYPIVSNLTFEGGSTNAYPYNLCVGDSLTAAYFGGAGADWCSQIVSTQGVGYAPSNWGISGLTTADIDRNAEMRWLPYVNGASNVILNGGSNDIAIGQDSGAAWFNLQDAIGKAKGKARRVFYWTVLSRNGLDVGKNSYNALYRSNAPSSGATLVDLAAVPQLGADGANANSACFLGDRTHLTGPANAAGTCAGGLTGYGLMAKYISNAINEADGSSQSSPDVTASNAYVEAAANRYVLQTPTAVATHQVFDCLALTGHTRTIVNGSASLAITMLPASGQTITGSTTVGPNQVATFTAELLSPTAGGCYWLRTQ